MNFWRRLALVIIILLGLGASAIIITGYGALAQADSAIQKADYRAAAEAYARAADRLFWRHDLYETAGFAALQAGDDSAAIGYFERAARSPRGQLALGYAYYRLGDFESARAAFDAGAELYRAAPFYEGLAFVFHAQQKWDEERRAVETQLQLNENDAAAHYRLGVLLTLHDSGAAARELMRAAKLDPRFDSAVQTLRAALNISTARDDPAEKQIVIGRALGLIEEWELARAAFQNAVEADAQNAEAWAWLGEARQRTDGTGGAELERALALNPRSPIVRGLRAVYWDRLQNYPQTLTEYASAAEYDPENPAWQAAIGETRMKMGDLVSALAAYQRAAELAPRESKYWRLLALFCADTDVRVEDVGLPAARKAVELAPDDPLALDALGYAYYATGRYANAEKILTDVVARFPDRLSAQLHLAMNYLAQGNNAAAYETLARVRAADPSGIYGQPAARLLEKYFP